MPCHRCGARESDPVRGPSAWRRGVRSGRQVLVCPDCQRGRDWTADLDSCPHCRSTALVRSLGETVCRDCAAQGFSPVPALAEVGGPAGSAGQPVLAAEVAAAIERVLGRAPRTDD